MKIKINTKKMKKALDIAERFRSGTAGGAMSGFLIEADASGLAVTATGGEAFAKVSVKDAGCIITEGSAVFPAKLRAVVNSCDAEYITIDAPEPAMAMVKFNRSKFKLALFSKLDYPRISFDMSDVSFAAPSEKMTKLIKSVAFAASKKESIPALSAVNLTLCGRTLNAEATDGYRIAVNKAEVDASDDASGVALVQAKALENLCCFPKSVISFYMSRNLCFTGEDEEFAVTAEIRTVNATFPNFDSIMNAEKMCNKKLVIKKNKFLSAIDRASLFADGDHHVVTLNLSSNENCKISSQAEIGSSDENLDGSFSGDDITCSFDLQYMKDVLKHTGSGDVKVSFGEELRPAFFHVDSDSGKYVILPVRTC